MVSRNTWAFCWHSYVIWIHVAKIENGSGMYSEYYCNGIYALYELWNKEDNLLSLFWWTRFRRIRIYMYKFFCNWQTYWKYSVSLASFTMGCFLKRYILVIILYYCLVLFNRRGDFWRNLQYFNMKISKLCRWFRNTT